MEIHIYPFGIKKFLPYIYLLTVTLYEIILNSLGSLLLS